MLTSLYLDTARLGRTSPAALAAQIEFARLTAEEPSSLYFEEFLRHGHQQSSKPRDELLPGLRCWKGVAWLKATLARIAGFRANSKVILAGQSSPLVELAAEMLCRHCHRILTTDLSWPAWQQAVERAASRSDTSVFVLPIREAILGGHLSADEVVRTVIDAFGRECCDGLFLPDVDNLGLRLPVRTIVRSIREEHELRFCVIDGAQAFGHVPPRISSDDCDLYLAGCHKWLGAYQPLRLAIAGNQRTQTAVGFTLQRMLHNGQSKDSLLSFTEQLESGRLDGISETTNLTPVFSACGAARCFPSNTCRWGTFRQQLRNAELVRWIATRSGWHAQSPHDEFLTGIVLIQLPGAEARALNPDVLRQRYQDAGLIVTTYDSGMVRLSMPRHSLRTHEIELIATAFQTVGLFATNRTPNSGPSLFPRVPAAVGCVDDPAGIVTSGPGCRPFERFDDPAFQPQHGCGN